MSEMNGHANGHGSSDEDESDVSSEGEMEEDVGEKSDDVASSRRLNGHSKKFDDDDFDENEDDEVEETGNNDGDDDDDDDDNDDDASDSDSAPEDVSFKTGRDAFQEKTQQQQRQIDKSQAAIKEKRRRRDELLKEQKAAKLKKLKESKLSTEFLQTLDSQPPTSTLPVEDRLTESVTESSASILPEEEGSSEPRQKRKLIPLPNVEGVEFEVVVGNTDADSQIMKKVNRYVKRHVQPKSVPRLSAKKKQSLNAKRNLLKKTRRWGLWNDEKDYVDDVLEAGENFVDEATR